MKLKALMLAFAAATSMFFFTACSDSPSEVVEGFADSMAEMDLEDAKEYTTGKARKEITNMIDGLKEVPESMKAKLEEEFKKEMGDKMSRIEIVSEDIDGENATVKIKYMVVEENKVTLKKVEGEWKISDLD
ncbi:MAG: DUF4878 domain-containing protein [Lentisphaeria bacterium]|nr:DUF4878 domain-containing protein [Lentisphaeria bacterium]